MKHVRSISITLAIAALAALIVADRFSVLAQSTAPAFVRCSGGGLLYQEPLGQNAQPNYRCVDPASLKGQAFTGVACAPAGTNTPVGGVTLYAQLPDKTCLPIIGVAPPGELATNIQAYQFETAMAGQQVKQYQWVYVETRPVDPDDPPMGAYNSAIRTAAAKAHVPYERAR